MSASVSENRSTSSATFLPLSFYQFQKFQLPFGQHIEQPDSRKRIKRASTDEDKSEEVVVEVDPDIELEADHEMTSTVKQEQPDVNNSDLDSVEIVDDDPTSLAEGNDTFVTDEISLSVCRVKVGSISIHCPLCLSVIPHVDVGHHIKNVHKVNRFTCPGLNCPNRIEFVDSYTSHIEKYHFNPTCATCSQPIDPRVYPDHLQICCRHLQSVKATILQPRNRNTETSAIRPTMIKPKPIELLLGIATSDNFQIYLDGKLTIVDGLHFYNRNGVLFLDCNLCAKALALPFYGSHLLEMHDRLSVICPAVYCSKVIESNTIQDHILSQHSRIRCQTCSKRISILEIKEHNDSCQKTKTSVIEPFAKAFLPAMGPTGIHFLSHFLEEKILRSQHPSLLDEREISPPQKPQTALQLDIESKSTVSMMNNSQQKKKSVQKAEKNGKIPTVPCPYCGKQCSYLNKHIRDVHQPKVHCGICGKRMGKSYLSEHMKIQHQGKEVPTKVCPLCGTRVQKLKNHLKYSHKMSREDADDVYSKFYPNSGRGQSNLSPVGKLPYEIQESDEAQEVSPTE